MDKFRYNIDETGRNKLKADSMIYLSQGKWQNLIYLNLCTNTPKQLTTKSATKAADIFLKLFYQ